MPETANSTTSSAIAVGNRFVLRYYTTLNSSPKDLQHFYKDKSVYTHGYEDGTEETAVGRENIGKKIQSLDFQDCKVTLSVVDCHDSLDGGVLIMVLGWMSNKGEAPKKFVETFFLAVQTEPVGFYVLNDAFRYINESPSPLSSEVDSSNQTSTTTNNIKSSGEYTPSYIGQAHNSAAANLPNGGAAVNTPSTTATTESSTSSHHEEKSAAPSTSSAAATTETKQHQQQPTTEKVHNKPSQQQQQPPQGEKKEQDKTAPESKPTNKAPAKQSSTAPKKEGVTAPAKNAQPKAPKPSTWASIVSQHSENQPAAVEESSPQQQQQQQQQQPAAAATSSPSVVPAAKQETKAAATPKEPKTPKVEVPSLYVSNLPFEVTEPEVRDQFAKYGAIKNIDMRAKGYCFIEYNDAQNVFRAIDECKTIPVYMGGRLLVVEERKTKGNREKKERKGPRPNKEGTNQRETASPRNSSPRTSQPKREPKPSTGAPTSEKNVQKPRSKPVSN